ncbi:DEAD/DEAH box helicase [Dissulfurirhabdus thermomarina]|uniref:DEAD/DEAH box helicase n=1 Tax=Dissulfurirhabdus thermomarina TaxID=1765737 RepID=A0A6N9TQ97_DISTH|nr:DEAD/DEAH box helicase [Dissulfurirhabdus thermomarina]NDY41607.1 DEAD/DEAH box helicase [Dissulfurirhabdus thermomarina]NMX23452.1 DEAD/DEAH box helicase [Dissulfurirhabdus thermomarina]
MTESRLDDFLRALEAAPRLGRRVVHHEVIPARAAGFAEPVRPLPGPLRAILDRAGVGALYRHQARALDLVRSGRDVVVATPTASGKTLVYNLPVLEQVLADPDSRALYLFPLKALAQDQLRALEALTAGWPGPARPTAAVYDGDTSPYRRRRLRERPPNVLLTNPEMLHLSLLAHHPSWAAFWAGLTHVVVDEVHTYRGVLGSHMAWVLRRLERVAARYGSRPAYVFSSATVANPAELARNLTGRPAEAVTESGAPAGERHVLFLDPEDGAAAAAIQLLRAALERRLRTIVYAQSRRLTELIALWAAERSGPYRDRISAYRAGFLPEERREIEARLARGDLLAVVTTSALELGIDIGTLDLCLLVGYPGTVMATWQRGGRVGRARRPSAVVLIAQEDALDQHFMRHPEDFFRRPPEPAVLNPDNPVIAARHLECAAAEAPLAADEALLASPAAARVAADLEARGRLLRSADGARLHAARRRPHRGVDLRGAGGALHIEDAATGETIGRIDEYRAHRETHPGAVYLHRGVTYLVEELDLEGRRVRARPARVDYFTRVRGRKETQILEVLDRRPAAGTRVGLARIRVTDRVTGYERRRVRGQALLTVVPLELPPRVFETEGLWIEVPAPVQAAVERAFLHFMGGIHAMEHAAIGILPLLVLADRNDLGGISTPRHPDLETAAVFIYDGVPGGVGLSRLAFQRAEDLLEETLRAVRDCPCELGCPSCVHSPKCGSGNRPIDKAAALAVLEGLCTGRAAAAERPAPPKPPPPPAAPGPAERPRARPARPSPRFGVFDLETRRSAEEVGGWHRAERMGVSVAVLYEAEGDAFHVFTEERIPELAERVRALDLLVGFNVKRFDYRVLGAYGGLDWHALPTLDILEEVHRRLGYRLSLDHLAAETLGARKSADGLQALRWWREGRMDLLAAYCREDVLLTRDLYLFGRRNGYLLFRNKAGSRVRIPVAWGP